MPRIESIETIPIRVPLPFTYKGSYYRMRNRCTIITTNLANEVHFQAREGEETSQRAEVRRAMRRETLGDRIGERMRSRLQEMCVVVEMQGQDYRQRVKRASFG